MSYKKGAGFEPAPVGVLEAETAIAGFADAVVYPVSSYFNGLAFWALTSGCCLDPFLVIVGDFGERFLVVF